MAASSTEGFASTSQTLGCFNAGLLKQEKFWTAEVMATASTGSFWEDEPEEVTKKKVNELKRKFHSGRQLQIKHLPRDVTEEEIRELLSDFPIQSVQLQCGTGSGMARAVLEDPEMLEEWDRDRAFHLRGQRVPVQPTPTEMMLCVARLPLNYTENQFSALVRTYGEICRSFLMISEKTGDSKGYGFVEYTTKEAAMQAKNMLDGKQVENWILCCDWLDSSHITFDSLHSKCLFVDKLPKDFRDMGEFRKVFSSVVNPPYCQIALRNGCPQDWGLVEYSAGEDAETAQTTLNGFNLHGQNIRICYYIPGVRAINLYLKLLNDSGNKGKATGLLPDPPAPAVFQQLQNLAKQNPVFAQSLQNIIWTQIQALQNGGENGKKPGSSGPPGKGKPPGAGGMQGGSVSGMNQGSASSSGNSATAPGPVADNAQAALVILLAAQMQAQMGNNHPSLLGNPQMLATLQNLIRQHQGVPGQGPGPGQGPPGAPPAHGMLAIQAPNPGPIGQPPPPHFAFPQNHDRRKVLHGSGMKNGFLKPNATQKVPLLPNPSGANMSPPPGEIAPRPPFQSPAALEDATNSTILGLSHIPIPDPANFWNGILGQIQGQQLSLNMPQLDPNLVKNGFFDHGLGGQKSPLHTDKPHFPQQGPSGANKLPLPHVLKQNGGIMFTDGLSGDLQQTINSFLNNAQNLNQLLGSLQSAMQTNGNGMGTMRQVMANPPGFPFVGQPGPLLQTVQPGPPPPPQPQAEQPWAMTVAPPPATAARPQTAVSVAAARPILGSPVAGGHPIISTPVPAGHPILASPVPMAVPPPKPIGFIDVKPGQIRPSPFQNGWATPGTFLASPTIPTPTPTQFGAYAGPNLVPNLWSHPGSPILIASPPGITPAGLVTPIGQKRKYNRLLPSPEPSPEGNYIGQHSQGLGGHYADSYFKRKKKN